MAIDSSVGYHGTVDEVEAARMDRFHGAPYAVLGLEDWKVTVMSAVDRTLWVEVGTGFGHHVMDQNGASAQVGPLPSGAGWYTIVARRDWGTNTTSFTYVTTPSATRTISGSREAEPGVLDDQPLALVYVNTSGNIVSTDVEDLRTWPSKVIRAESLVTLQMAYDYPPGTEAVVQGRRWRFDTVNGSLQWAPTDKRTATGTTGLLNFNASGRATVTHGLGWTPSFFSAVPILNQTPVVLGVPAGSTPYTSTTATVAAFNVAGGPYTSGLAVRWFASE